ncbi:MAG: aminodeoxychorismate synthase component I [Gammaproteobacteria bacterium]|nr:aminodeoxychorismate synthase component I [Gammaproteobacteria bacterium]
MKLSELPYRRNSADVFEAVSGEPWAIFLDSGYPYIDSGRYDIMAARPYLTLTTHGDDTVIRDRHGTRHSGADPFQLVREALGEGVENLSGMPFCGGALGYFSYDLGRRIESLPETAERDLDMPDMAIGLYDWAVVVDHHKRRSWLIGQGRDPETERRWSTFERMFTTPAPTRLARYQPQSPIRANMDKAAYMRAFDRIKAYIREGDCYQVNLAQRFEVDVQGDAWDMYLHFRRHNPAPFASFLRLDGSSVMSCSPERFLNVQGGQVETKPIKGTIRRSSFAYEDKALAAQLLESEKDRAENLMIVDLLRNDLGKNCRTGSVAVPKLFALESFATVHHLVSTVTGRLAEGRHALDLLRGCFPGGSITGAPKLRSMEIIEELEPHRRNVYCGAIGYIGFDGNMDTSIVIRTAVRRGGQVYYWAGGGIVWDSQAEAEYEECFAKARVVLRLFEQGAARDVGN